MAETTIGWTATVGPDGTVYPGYTFNPWRGCTKVSQGCKHCYADTWSVRNPATLGVWGPNGTRAQAAEKYWDLPVAWNAHAQASGIRRKVFCSSLADVFEDETTMPVDAHGPVAAARARLWATIEATPYLDWLLLTKRPHNITAMLPKAWEFTLRHNLWLGTSAEDQATADERIPELIDTLAYGINLFVSCEPLLGPITFSDYWLMHLDWLIIGGESGSKARPMNLAWAEGIIAQADDFTQRHPSPINPRIYMKQLGTRPGIPGKGEHLADFPTVLQRRAWPDSHGPDA